jgi:hypothetical protein|tara:strand:+ start:349 stop:516 length:168 start_codon:yes stop_codon:yes gene_type:complete
MKVKGINIDSLNKRQQGAMKRHAKHHNKSQIKKMVSLMNKGKTFLNSHKMVMKKK